MNSLKQTAIAVAVGLSALPLAAQNRPAGESFKPRIAVGLSFSPEWQPNAARDPGFIPSFGLTVEGQFSRHSGIELGIFDRPQTVTFMSIFPDNPNNGRKPTLHYASLRLSYKFWSDIVNFTAGMNWDISPDKVWHGALFNNRFGFCFSVSKDFRLCKGLILEPAFHVNPVLVKWSDDKFTGDGTFIGLDIKVKYRF